MKTLFVLRHAKSSWDHPNLSDFERPLNKRGKKTAPFMGALMAERGLIPDLILSSPAKRAEQTSELVKQYAVLEAEISFDHLIYEASPNTLLNIVSEIDDKMRSAMIVGHNPGFEGIVQALTGNYERMPTAALAVIDLAINSWSNIETGSGRLRELLRPKEQQLAGKNT